MSYDNYIIGASLFFPTETPDLEFVKNLNRFIAHEMDKRGFIPNDTNPWELNYGKPTFTLTFSPSISSTEARFSDRVKRAIGLVSSDDLVVQLRDRFLLGAINEYPRRVTFLFNLVTQSDGPRGVRIRVESEPMILAKNRFIGTSLDIGRGQYERIVAYNTRFLKEIATSFLAQVTEEPKVLSLRLFSSPEPILDPNFIETFPTDVAISLQAANSCFVSEHYLPCSVMLRKAIDVALTKKFLQSGEESRLKDKEDNEISYQKKLNIIVEIAPKTRRDVDQVKLVKWLGDRAAHDPTFEISPSDIRENIPRVKAFLTDLQLKK